MSVVRSHLIAGVVWLQIQRLFMFGLKSPTSWCSRRVQLVMARGRGKAKATGAATSKAKAKPKASRGQMRGKGLGALMASHPAQVEGEELPGGADGLADEPEAASLASPAEVERQEVPGGADGLADEPEAVSLAPAAASIARVKVEDSLADGPEAASLAPAAAPLAQPKVPIQETASKKSDVFQETANKKARGADSNQERKARRAFLSDDILESIADNYFESMSEEQIGGARRGLQRLCSAADDGSTLRVASLFSGTDVFMLACTCLSNVSIG
jgi:hypothetical protein